MKIGGGAEQGTSRIFVSGGEDEKQLTRREVCKKNSEKKSGSIFAGDLIPVKDKIEEKREESRNKIAKLIGDQFATDTKIDDKQAENRQKVKDLGALEEELNAENNTLRAEKEALKEKYGISDDSQEQKDLELREKVMEADRTHRLDSLSSEELEEFAKLGPMTDYQKEALAREEIILDNTTQMDGIRDEKSALTRSIIGTKNAVAGRMYDMTDVGYAVDVEKKATAEEIAYMAVQDAKDHMDEEMEKLQEKAEKLAEEKKKKEEQAEKAADKEKTPEEAQAEKQQESVKDINEGVQNQDEMNRQLKKIMEDGKLINEDLKGLVVNENL